MTNEMINAGPRWFVLNYIPVSSAPHLRSVCPVVEKFNVREKVSLEVFAPTVVSAGDLQSPKVLREKPLIFHYVFVRGSFEQVKRLCAEVDGFSFLLDRGSEGRYAVVSDRRMAEFRIIARAYENMLPFYSLEDIDLEEGDKVEVIDGAFSGLTGYFMPKRKSSSGNILLAVTQNLATVAYSISARYVRVLEFSKKSRRGYDQIDAIVPKLFAAMRKFHSGEPMTEGDLSPLAVFSRRMSAARMDNNKIQCKLYAILYACCLILGDVSGAKEAEKGYFRLESCLTSGATQALVNLLRAVTTRDRAEYSAGTELLGGLSEKSSRSLDSLRREYEFYGEYFGHVAGARCSG